MTKSVWFNVLKKWVKGKMVGICQAVNVNWLKSPNTSLFDKVLSM